MGGCSCFPRLTPQRRPTPTYAAAPTYAEAPINRLRTAYALQQAYANVFLEAAEEEYRREEGKAEEECEEED